jgi:hypothetical protein
VTTTNHQGYQGREAIDPPEQAVRLGIELARIFDERNYLPAYLARRCRTEPGVVEQWRAGSLIPTHAEWWYLNKVHRDFSALSSLWQDARTALGVEEDDAADVAVLRGRATEDSTARRASAAPSSPTAALAAPEARHAAATTHPAQRDVRTDGGSAPASSDGGSIPVPAGFAVYRCRITRGRILAIPLPADLSRADVDRLCAFLQTQADDDEPPTRR